MLKLLEKILGWSSQVQQRTTLLSEEVGVGKNDEEKCSSTPVEEYFKDGNHYKICSRGFERVYMRNNEVLLSSDWITFKQIPGYDMPPVVSVRTLGLKLSVESIFSLDGSPLAPISVEKELYATFFGEIQRLGFLMTVADIDFDTHVSSSQHVSETESLFNNDTKWTNKEVNDYVVKKMSETTNSCVHKGAFNAWQFSKFYEVISKKLPTGSICHQIQVPPCNGGCSTTHCVYVIYKHNNKYHCKIREGYECEENLIFGNWLDFIENADFIHISEDDALMHVVKGNEHFAYCYEYCDMIKCGIFAKVGGGELHTY